MDFDGIRQDGTLYVATVSRGKDSTAMLFAIEKLGWPLDGIVSVDVWATKTIPAELPPMVAFKDEWDQKVLELFGVPVTRLYAKDKEGNLKSYEDIFYKVIPFGRKTRPGMIQGWPLIRGPWCNSDLKRAAMTQKGILHALGEERKTVVRYIGIAADEPQRIERWMPRENFVLPLVQIGWTEAECRKIAEENGMLAPTYQTGERDGCWFCHNQGLNQLRRIRRDYPDLWEILLKWDSDSPVKFKGNRKTVHDYDERFRLEDEGLIDKGERFKWTDLICPCRQMTIFDFLEEQNETYRR